MTGLTILQYTQRWVLIDSHWYRAAWVRTQAGAVELWAIPETEAP